MDAGATRGRATDATLRITELSFKAGATSSSPPLKVATGNITILVGPNNVGKSLALREIERACVHGPGAQSNDVVSWVTIDTPTTVEGVFSLLRRYRNPDVPVVDNPGNEQLSIIYPTTGGAPNALHIGATPIAGYLHSGNWAVIRATVMPPYTLRLDGRTRFGTPTEGPTGALLAPAQTYLQGLLRDDVARRKVQDLTFDAFGWYVALDASTMPGQLRLRMSQERPPIEYERSFKDDAARFYDRQPLVTTFSDGVQAFVSIVGSVVASPYRVILIDEPEAFLHPPLARRLGAELTRLARERDASLVVATHSDAFVMGCLDESSDTAIVRLTYQRETGAATARVVPPDDLRRMVRHPLLRSTGVLDSLFHETAVVTEGDSDRVFYDEINQRLLRERNGRGLPDTLFLNAGGWTAAHLMVRPMRHVGIPVAAVVDMESLDDANRTKWPQLLEACQVPDDERARLETGRESLRGLVAAASDGHGRIKKEGLAFFTGADWDRAGRLFRSYAAYGLFVVPVGEVERWLKPYSNTKHASEWLIALFERIGLDDQDPNYLRPRSDDVWAFIDGLATWARNPDRLGTG